MIGPETDKDTKVVKVKSTARRTSFEMEPSPAAVKVVGDSLKDGAGLNQLINGAYLLLWRFKTEKTALHCINRVMVR